MPVFTTAAATLRTRRASRNASLASPLTTDATTTTPDAAPISPQPESESTILKATRAYERDRQRAKKRKERADRERERNASHHSSASDSADGHPRRSGGAGPKPTQRLVADDRDPFSGTGTDPGSPGVEEIIADVVEREAQARGAVNVRAEPEPVQVHLAQLVKPSKTRKSKAGEFELVPGMPVVIALDDHCMPAEAELDEPWEHISADELDEKRVEPPSYATVLANAL